MERIRITGKKPEANNRGKLLPETYTGTDCLDNIGEIISEKFPGGRAVVIMDNMADERHFNRLAASLTGKGVVTEKYSIHEEQAYNILDVEWNLLGAIGELRLTKKDVLIALGGEKACNCAGFAANIYLGGVSYVLVPTTLRAMLLCTVCDSVALKLRGGESYISSKGEAKVVFCDTGVMQSLSQQVFCDGAAELVRLGMLASPTLLNVMQYDYRDMLDNILCDCMMIRSAFFVRGEVEPNAPRLLQFGDVLGDVIEKAGRGRVSGGQALAAGMAILTRAAMKCDICSEECYAVLEKTLASNLLPTNCRLTAEVFFRCIVTEDDRKVGIKGIVLPAELGKCVWYPMPIDRMEEFLKQGLNE